MYYQLFSFGVAALVYIVLKRRYFTNISNIPGPFPASFSLAWQLWHICKGDVDRACQKLHEKHGTYIVGYSQVMILTRLGSFVRISHDEVSVCHPDAVRQILLNPLHKVDNPIV